MALDDIRKRKLQQDQNPKQRAKTPQDANISPVGNDPAMGSNITPFPGKEAEPMKMPVDENRCHEWSVTLAKYRAGKVHLERRVTEAERWWKLRNSYEERKLTDPKQGGLQTGSAWLHNVIVSKHADAIEAYPQPNILPREESDKVEAWALSQIVPCIMEQNHFESTYDAVMWQKLKTGTGVYKVVWDKSKMNGLGDITITRVNLLNLFWEPGIENIQDSRMVFHTETVDKDTLLQQYPELEDKKLQSAVTPKKMPTDDTVSDDGKVVVIDVYYKQDGLLHYAKYVGDTVLYSTENDGNKGLYDHGLYPFVFDVLYPIEGSPAGYGFIDVCANPQTRIDMMNNALLKNTMASCTPRYFERQDGSINEEEFLNLENTIIHVNGNLGEDAIRLVSTPAIGAYYSQYLQNTIQELRETSGNTETSTGSNVSASMAASAIASLQEASGKGSRAASLTSYRAYSEVVNLVIELIRQFMDLPRQFRITGQMGVQKFIEFNNAGMQPQWQGTMGGMDMGYRLPVYDIKIEPQKKNRYTQIAQNEMIKELFGMGLFAPENVNQALLVLDVMDFDGKDTLMQKLAQQGTMYQTLLNYQQLALGLAHQYRPDLAQGIAQDILGQNGQPTSPQQGQQAMGNPADENSDGKTEHPFVERAREQSADASQPR